MSNFLERNKRKSYLALLLLLLPSAKKTETVLLLVILLGLFHFAPGGRGQWIPWPHVAPFPSKISSFPGKVLPQGRPRAKFQPLKREIRSMDRQPASSLNMAQGGGQVDNSVYSPFYRERITETISGVLSPEESRRYARGVPLDQYELLAGLAKNSSGSVSTRPGANSENLNQGRAVPPEDAIVPRELYGLRNFSQIRRTGRGGGFRITGGPSGKVSSFSRNQVGYSISDPGPAVTTLCAGSSPCAPEFNLAEANAYSCLAAQPGSGGARCSTAAQCTTGSCPAEYASYASGAPFAGTRGGGLGILTTHNDPVPLTPDAKPKLLAEKSDAEKEQNCADTIRSSNAQVAAARDQLASCCANIDVLYNSCPASCSSLFWFFNSKCAQCRRDVQKGASDCGSNYWQTVMNIGYTENKVCGFGANQVKLPPNCDPKTDPNCQPTKVGLCHNGIPYY